MLICIKKKYIRPLVKFWRGQGNKIVVCLVYEAGSNENFDFCQFSARSDSTMVLFNLELQRGDYLNSI